MKLWIVALALVASGCAALPSSQAKMRQQVQSEFRPAPVYEQLLAFHDALVQTPGVELEHVAILTRWIALGVRTLRGDDPSSWEAVARPGWPQVRSLIGPYDTLQPFAATFDHLLQ